MPSFREIMAPLIREERSEFTDILKCYKENIPMYTPFLFFLNISLELYAKTQKTVKKIEDLKKVIGRLKSDLTENGSKKISELKAELNALDYELNNIRNAVESFKGNDAYDAIEKEIIELEDILDNLRLRQNSLKYELQKINSLPKPEVINDEEIKILYNKFKAGLGDNIAKSLNDTIDFKHKIEKFQRNLINDRANEIKLELDKITENIIKFDDLYSDKIKLIDQKGILKNLKTSLKIYEQKNNEFSRKKVLFNEYEQVEKEKKQLLLIKSQQIAEIDADIENNKSLINDSFLTTLSDIHDKIMGNRSCSFSLSTINKNNSKKTVDFELRTYDDGSHSVERTKVFIFDMALLFNEYTKDRHPKLLIHDNIFDVDQDTLVQSLNFLTHQEEKHSDFQYILTLNRDKIENEEKAKEIILDIEKHRRAVFTKESKFLKVTYQEL